MRPYSFISKYLQASGWELVNPIAQTEMGVGVAFSHPIGVWTGTLPAGTPIHRSLTCSGFSSRWWSEQFYQTGTHGLQHTSDSLAQWTAAGASTCDSLLRLYCFEQ